MACERPTAGVADFLWPADLKPRGVSFYLQPHVGGAESPITRTRKVYGLSAPRWIARLRFRGGYWQAPRLGDAAGFGARLDGLITDLNGGLNRALLWDFRRPRLLAPPAITAPLTFGAAAAGASAIVLRGFAPNSAAVSVGDYLGGDGRPHIVSLMRTIAAGGTVTGAGTVMANGAGQAIVGFNPPLRAAVAEGTPAQWPVTAPFRLVSEDAGDNDVEAGQAVEYTLDFVEDLL